MNKPETHSDCALISFQFGVREDQKADLRLLATYEIAMGEHIRRSIDDYRRRPDIAAALVELKGEPEAQDFEPDRPEPYDLTEKGTAALKDLPPMPHPIFRPGDIRRAAAGGMRLFISRGGLNLCVGLENCVVACLKKRSNIIECDGH